MNSSQSLRFVGLALLGLGSSACGDATATHASVAPSESGAAAPTGRPPSSTSSAASSAPSPPTAAPVVLDDAAVKSLGLSSNGEKALRSLADAAHFGGWAVGAAGSPTPPVSALRVLMEEKNASKALQLVLEKGTLAGQLMALAGLYDVDPAAFAKALASRKGMQGEVRLMSSGCAPGGDPVPAAQVIERADAVRLDGPKDDLGKWSARNPGKPIEFDIAGGGYTAAMRPRS